MKRLVLFFAIALGLSIPAAAQQQHSVTLTWIDNQTGNPTWSIYRVTVTAATVCPTIQGGGGLAFVKISPAALTVKSYVDTTVVAGAAYCYAATATENTIESGLSIASLVATIPTAFPPGAPSIVVQ